MKKLMLPILLITGCETEPSFVSTDFSTFMSETCPFDTSQLITSQGELTETNVASSVVPRLLTGDWELTGSFIQVEGGEALAVDATVTLASDGPQKDVALVFDEAAHPDIMSLIPEAYTEEAMGADLDFPACDVVLKSEPAVLTLALDQPGRAQEAVPGTIYYYNDVDQFRAMFVNDAVVVHWVDADSAAIDTVTWSDGAKLSMDVFGM